MTAASPAAILRNVSYRYPGADRFALSGVTWDIDRDSFTLVAGESGSGKSTLLRTLNGLVPHYAGGRFGGNVIVAGRDTRRTGPRDLAAHVGFVFQDPEAQLVTTRVEDEIAFGPEQFGMEPRRMRVRVEEALDLVGIAHLRHRETATLSGGERQRVAIAAALALRPDLLVLDEPTSQLDPWAADEMLSGLRRLNDDFGLTIVLAEHRLDRLLPWADAVRYALPDGSWLTGDRHAVIADDRVPLAMLPPVAQLGRRCGMVPMPTSVRDGRRALTRRPITPAPIPVSAESGTAPVLAARGVSVRLSDGLEARPVLRQVDVAIAPGEIVALMGRNGSGKTTLLRTLVGLQRPSRGTLTLNGQPFLPWRDGPSPAIAYLPQNPGTILSAEHVRDELRLSRRAGRHAPAAALLDPDDLLDRMGLTGLADAHPRDLSGGQRQRVALAAILAVGPAVVLLDEPTRGMDGVQKQALIRLLRDLAAAGTAVIVATHDVELAAGLADRVVMLGGGEVVVDASARAALAGALAYGPQINKLFGGQYLTVADVLGESPRPRSQIPGGGILEGR